MEVYRNFQGDRYSPLTRIAVENARTLGFAWEYQARSRRGRWDTVKKRRRSWSTGVLYVGAPGAGVYAVDGKMRTEV